MEIQVFKQAVGAVAVHARQITGLHPEKTIVGRTFELDAAACGSNACAPLMPVVAGGAGNIADRLGLAGGFVEKGEVVVPAFRIAADIGNQFAFRVSGHRRVFIGGDAILRVTASAHHFRDAVAAGKIPGPQLDFIAAVMNQMTDAAGS